MGSRIATARPSPSQCMPYPELVADGPAWTVLDSHDRPWLPSDGVTDKVSRVVYAPLRPDGHAVAIHELAHCAWSPTRLPRVRFEPLVLHATEDARINLALSAIGSKMVIAPARLAHVRLLGARDLHEGRLAVFVLRAVASLGTNAEPALRAEAADARPHLRRMAEHWLAFVETRLERARRRAAGPVAPFRIALDTARALARQLERHGLLTERLAAKDLPCCVVVPEEADGSEIPAFMRRRHRRRPPEDKGQVLPGTLRLEEAPLRVGRAASGRPIGPRWRPTPEGSQLGRIHRIALDGAIFRRRVRYRGGTVLIDTSGSMSFGEDQLDELVEASSGAALVAIYSGKGREGQLRIVARSGRRTTREHLAPFGSGNVVDLPALQWLSRQAEPRLWVSDGGVTGIDDEGCVVLRARCKALARRARIARVTSAEDAAERLAKKTG